MADVLANRLKEEIPKIWLKVHGGSLTFANLQRILVDPA